MNYRFVMVVASAITVACSCFLYRGMPVMDVATIAFSLGYQLGAIPWEIIRNFQTKMVDKVPYALTLLGAASYTASTFRAVLQPDWIDVASRWCGMTGLLIVIVQIIIYDRVRLSPYPPYVVKYTRHGHLDTFRCGSCRSLSVEAEDWPRKCECGNPLHVIEAETDPIWAYYLTYCSKCDKEVLTTEAFRSPFGDKTAYWLFDGGEWHATSYRRFAATCGALTCLYNSENGIHGVVTNGQNPAGLSPTGDEVARLARAVRRSR